jgi:hypothetical protein
MFIPVFFLSRIRIFPGSASKNLSILTQRMVLSGHSRAHKFRITFNKLFEWFFSRVLASHAGGLGSIPGRDL